MTPPTGTLTVPADTTSTLPLEQLAPGHWPNPRGDVDTTSDKFAELAASIAKQGILEPIVIGPALDEADGRHPIIAGWRRYTAALMAGLETVPVHHRPDIADRRAALRAALAENMAREDMTPMAEASAIAELVDLGDTQVEAAKAVGVSERTARERLRMLELPKAVRDAIAAGDVPTTCTRQLQVIADASPAAAGAIAKKIQKGSVRALDLLEPKRLGEVLSKLDAKAGLVKLVSWTSLKRLSLTPETYQELKARNAEASSYGDGAQLDLSSRVLGTFIDEAAAAGKVIRCAELYGGDSIYLAGAEWHEKAARLAVERVEADAAERQATRDAHNADRGIPADDASAGEDPELQRQEAQRKLADAIDERAVPYAARMNAELGQRLRELTTCTIEGPVARVLLELAIAPDSQCVDFAIGGYKLVDPENTWAQCQDAYAEDAYEAWDAAIRGAETPEHAAAEIIKPIIACVFADGRADGVSGAKGHHGLWTELEQAARAAGVALRVVPDRAIALADARAQLALAQSRQRLQAARRRILFELDKVDKGRLEREVLIGRAGTWGRDAGDLLGIAMQVPDGPHGTFSPALQDLVDDGHVKITTKGDSQTVTIAAAGRKALKALPDLTPIIADVDAGAEPIVDEHEPDDSPAAASSRKDLALKLIGAQPGITIPGLAGAMGIKQNYLYRLLPGLADEGKVRKEGRGWYPQLELDADAPAGDDDVVIVHVTPTGGGDPVEAELQPDPPKGKSNSRKVIYTASRTAAWVAESRITDLPTEATA